MDDGGSAGTVAVPGDFGEIVSGSVGDTGDTASGDLSGNLNVLLRSALDESCGWTHRSSLPSASGFGLLGRGSSIVAVCDKLVLRCGAGEILPPLSSDALLETVGLSRDPFLEEGPTTCGPTMLIRAIVSGDGERRTSSGTSRMGEDGAEEVNGREERLSGSGRLNGAGAGSACVIWGTGGSRWFEIGTSLRCVSEFSTAQSVTSRFTFSPQPPPIAILDRQQVNSF